MKTVLVVGHKCNNRCRFCSRNQALVADTLGLGEVNKRIRRLKESGIDTIVLAGGEPTIRPDFFDIATGVRDMGLDLGLISNGRMFSYKNFTGHFSAFSPVFTQTALYSSNSHTHDALAGVSGAFSQTLAGIKNMAAAGLKGVTICVPVNRHNLETIGDIPDLVAALGLSAARIKFSAAEACGLHGICDIAEAPEGATAARCVSQMISRGIERHASRGMTFRWEGFSPCQIPDYPELGSEPLAEDFAFVWSLMDDDFAPAFSPGRQAVGFQDCLVCSRHTRCFSSRRAPRTPFIENVPNAAGYDYVRTLDATAGMSCPAGMDLCAGLHPLLDTAVLREDDKIEVYSHTENCSGRALYEVKFRREQLYLNVSGLSRNLDFRTAFKKLHLHEKCRACMRPPARSGVFVPVEGNAFFDVEENEKAWLMTLRGTTLDIGCGKPLFPHILSDKIRSGDIEYLGVDRYPECSEELKTVAVDFEDFEWEGQPFDNILMLRCYNHFKDPRPVLTKAAGLLKPGGILRICDNALFAMLKNHSVDNPTKHDRPAHQHFRNHHAEDAHELISQFDVFEDMEHTAVESGGANQWFLALRKKS